MKILAELKRRNVLRMAALYVVTAWLLMQVADVLIDLGRLPESYGPLALQVLGIGLPIALALSWFLEGTHPDAAEGDKARQKRARCTDFAIIGVMAAALGLFAYLSITESPIERSVAVLPFEDLTGDADDSYLPDGIAEEIRHRLTTFGNLKVIDGYSVNKVRGLALATIASKLNVEHVLQGSVRRSGNRVRILASLVDAETNETTWSDSYDGDLTVAGLFDVQVDIARAIAEKLRSVISPEAEAQMANAPTQDPEAYRLYLLGLQRLNGSNTEEQEQARGFFERAIEIDAGFAEAYAYLALAPPCDQACRRDATEKALVLDDKLGIAYAAGARFIDDPEQKRKQYALALRFAPGDAAVWSLYGSYLHFGLGDFQAALDAYDRAIALQPMMIDIYASAGISAFMLNRPDDAIAYFERGIQVDPDHPLAYVMYATEIWNFNQVGYDEAVALLHKAYELDPDAFPLYMLGWLCTDLGDIQGAESLFEAIGSVPGRADLFHLRGAHTAELAMLEYMNRESMKRGRGGSFARGRLVPHYIDAGRFDEALELIRKENPGLVDSLVINTGQLLRFNMIDGFRLARVLEGHGKVVEAAKLWDQLDRLLASTPQDELFPGSGGLRIYPAIMQARRGRNEVALQLMRKIVDSKWSAMWRQMLSKSDFDTIRDDPRFRQMVAEIEANMAEQLAKVHAQGLACEVPPTWSMEDAQ